MNSTDANNIFHDIKVFYKQMEEKYGMTFTFRAKYGATGCKGSFEINPKANGNIVLAPVRQSITPLVIASTNGQSATAVDPRVFINKSFKVRKTTYTVKGYDASKPKFAFSVITSNGADWQVTRDFVINNCKL